ncbi:uncharacterized protein LOC111495723 [Cucurbita maxima]|uniref:Uncharacterized protein LOC111495723 n=1 Tax=Cucurbita maxima TaxID=3661 RepID=A0A6J1KH80_CUCMA|nr:uncharacterized protein LOC111495723 [Cucurbita maxima]
MRPVHVLASLLLMFFLFDHSQGVRLGNGLMKPLLLGTPLEEEVPLVEENGHCNSGKSRKLLMETSPSSPTPSTTRNKEGNKKGNPGMKEQDMKSSKAVSENLEAGHEQQQHYPDLIEIAEMDYSPATRKPPIHN